MKKDGVLTSEKPIFGFKAADLLGLVVMIVPFVITIMPFDVPQEVKKLIFFKSEEVVSKRILMPGIVSALCSAVFYGALIARFKLFISDNLLQGIISAIRTFLNCWVIAALLTMVVPTEKVSGLSVTAFLQNHQTVLLLLAILLSWVGMRTMSGYCWIFFIIAAWEHISKLDQAMGAWGAVFVITLAISLFLQISSYADIGDVIRDFNGSASVHASTVRNNMSAAAADASQRAESVSNFVKDNVAAYTPVKLRTAQQSQVTAGTGPVYYVGKNVTSTGPAPSRSMPTGNPEDILKALDVNGDGVVDEKDIELLRRKN